MVCAASPFAGTLTTMTSRESSTARPAPTQRHDSAPSTSSDPKRDTARSSATGRSSRRGGDAPLILGNIYLPSGSGTPVGRFEFIVDPASGAEVEIGVPVAAETSEGVVIGAVVDMRTVGTASDPVAVDIASVPGMAPIGTVPEVVLATVQVFHSPALRSVRAGTVRAASPQEIAVATGADKIDWQVPAGVIPLADGSFARVAFDGHALLGPESQGLCVGGLSGQAAKSSYIGVLMASALASGAAKGESTAALVFNVKGTDFCHLDEAPLPGYELRDDDIEMYRALGVEPSPFRDVTIFAPALPAASRGTRSDRADARRLAWDLPMVWPYLRFFLGNVVFEDEKVASFLAEFRQLCLENPNPAARVDTFAKLDCWFDERLADAEANENQWAWRSHHKATMWRLRRMLTSLVARCGGLVITGSANPVDDVPATGWDHGQVVVVDIAGLTPDVQGVVIARTIERVLRSAENGELGVDHLMLVMDELNSFAPSVGTDMAPVRKIISRVATQGRYAGVSLIGAGQALSRVDELIVTNAATRALGRTADAELASGTYGRLSSGLAERIATLPKGWMALSHYAFRSILLVRFPRPAWRTGKGKTTGAARPKTTSVLGITERSVDRLREGIPDDLVETIISSSPDPSTAMDRLNSARVPDMKKVVVHEPSTFDPDNPFALD